jgi:hypothetical protein
VTAALAKHPDTLNLAACADAGLPVDVILRASRADQQVWFAIADEVFRRRNQREG